MENRQTAATPERKRSCHVCGRPLNAENGWRYRFRMTQNLYGPLCDTCANKYYQAMSSDLGYKFGFFVTCAALNVPYLPKYFETSKAKVDHNHGRFAAYLMTLRENGLNNEKTGCKSFADGITDVKRAFGGEFETLEISDEELEAEDYKSGIIQSVENWGHGPAERPYTEDDYAQLEKMYNALADNRVNITPQAEIVMRNVAVMRLEQQKCVYAGEFLKAKQIEDICIKELESEQLRKKDELPQDRVRLDDIAIALERAGLVGLSYDELCEKLCKHMFHTPYGYTRDAADQMLLHIVNATRFNEGYSEIDRLPDEFAISDPMGEFAAEPDEQEKKTYRDLQISPLHMKPKGGE